jgi:signal transduction histidine kinase
MGLQMYYRFTFLLILAISLLSIDSLRAAPKAERGVMDLRQIENPGKFILNLNGEWEFYWNKLLHPDDLNVQEFKPDYYGRIPSYWTDYTGAGVKTDKFGFATYRLTIILPENFRAPLGFDLPVFDSSYELYINGLLEAENGKPGRTEKESIPGYRKNFVKLIPESDTIRLLVNVSNFHHRRGGFWLPVTMGTLHDMQKRTTNILASEWAIVTILIGFAIFFLFFFILSPKDKSMLFISLTTAGLAIRPLFTSHFLIQNFVMMDWVWTVRLEYISLYCIIIGWSWFLDKTYNSPLIRVTSWFITAVYFTSFILTLLLPVKVFSYITYLYYPCVIFLMSYQLTWSFLGSLRKNLVDILYFLSSCLLLFGGVHDIRVASGNADISAGYLMTYLIVIFVFIQAGLLLYKWIHAFNEKEKLQKELEYMNRNLEIIVDERTQELTRRNEEIENQNNRIALQNKQLSDTINLKNRIFSLIAHDLRSPVVNILYMLNLLKEEEYKSKYDEFANSSISYAQMVINLLENMLVWGRGQEDKIKYSPERLDLAEIVLTNLSIFKESADNKEISVNFTQSGSTKAYIDKDLLDIIIRNLLSNAVKYTPRGGRISIILKDRTAEREGIQLRICDNGVGMSETKRMSLFSSAEVESTQGTEKEKGTGFGLKLCQDLVLLNNGTIDVESREGDGTCFIINLPVDKVLAG